MGVPLTVLLATNVVAGVWILPALISWSGPGFIIRHEWGPEEEVERRIAARRQQPRGRLIVPGRLLATQLPPTYPQPVEPPPTD
jgi:hypothetical protein